MLGSLPDAGLRFIGCLVVMVNSLLEVGKVLEAEKGKKARWNQVWINVLTEAEVRSRRGHGGARHRANVQEPCGDASAGLQIIYLVRLSHHVTSSSLSRVFTHSNYHFKPITAPLMLLLNYSVYSQKMGWCEREIIEVTERGKRWHQIPHRSLTLLLHCPPGHFHISLWLIHRRASLHLNICCRKSLEQRHGHLLLQPNIRQF